MNHDLGNPLSNKPLSNVRWTNLKLCTLSLSFEWNHQARDGNPFFQHGQMAILNAPLLQHLSVNIWFSDREDPLGFLLEPRNSLGSFRFTTNRMLPPMKTLALRGYSVGLDTTTIWSISSRSPSFENLPYIPVNTPAPKGSWNR